MESIMVKFGRKDCFVKVSFVLFSYFQVFDPISSKKYSSKSKYAHVQIPLARMKDQHQKIPSGQVEYGAS